MHYRGIYETGYLLRCSDCYWLEAWEIMVRFPVAKKISSAVIQTGCGNNLICVYVYRGILSSKLLGLDSSEAHILCRIRILLIWGPVILNLWESLLWPFLSLDCSVYETRPSNIFVQKNILCQKYVTIFKYARKPYLRTKLLYFIFYRIWNNGLY
jgi:hypothetical protein